jgi:uncharacterized protein (DUF433 family)
MSTGAARGAYAADRASALSGVPRSTIHYWARHKILVPSVSPSKVKLWSYTDLMGLRTISWLRHRKVSSGGWDVPATTMPAVRRALASLAELDLDLWSEDGGPSVRVDGRGAIFLITELGPETPHGHRPLDPDMLDLIEPFTIRAARGPDLQKPRPHLRIVPGKLSGSPHIAHSRIETLAVAALAGRGYDSEKLVRLYPQVEPIAIAESLDLERQLSANLRAA